MSNLMRRVFLDEAGKNDQEIHEAFLKYSKGTFEAKYILEAKKQKDKWAIKTSAEYGNYLVRRCLADAKGPLKIKGAIISTLDVKDKINFEIEKVKNYMGIKQILIDNEVDSSEILSLMDKFPRAFFALSFKTERNDLKIKPKPPKGAKPSSKGDKKPKADFCSLKTTDPQFTTDLFFDHPEFKEVSVEHTIIIEDIEIPKNIGDPVQMREKALRKGKIIRKITADGNEFKEDKAFIA